MRLGMKFTYIEVISLIYDYQLVGEQKKQERTF